MRILFLDVDGVLNSREDLKSGKTFVPEMVDRIINIIKTTGCLIVVSSSRKIGIKNLGKQSSFFKNLISDCPNSYNLIIDSIIGITGDSPNYLREEEILNWVNGHVECTNWVAVDDLPLELPLNHFVKTDNSVGLTDALTDEIVFKLMARD